MGKRRNAGWYCMAGASALYLAGAFLLRETPFFWDSVSILSDPATFLYENRFTDFSFPEGSVTDNLPLSMLLAFWWMIFGRSLLATHLLFALFGLALLCQIYKLCVSVLGGKNPEALPWVFALVVSDTTLVTQILIPMFDPVLLLAAIGLLRSLLEGKKAGVLAASIALAMLRSRGVILLFALGLFEFLHRCGSEDGKFGFDVLRRNFFKNAPKALAGSLALFAPAIGTAVLLLALQAHLQQAVFGFSADSPWQIASAGQIARNVLALPRFLLDFGKIFIWVAAAGLFFRFGRKRFLKAVPATLLLACLCTGGVLAAMTLPFRNPLSGRYFLLFFLLFALFAGKMVFSLLPVPKARWVSLGLILLLWGGHAMRYPEGMAVSWDSTLAHLPYYPLRQEAVDYLEGKGVPPSQVRAFFPYDKPSDAVCLNGKEAGRGAFEKFSGSREAPYVLYSNIANLSGREAAGIDSGYVLEKRFSRHAVYFELWSRKEASFAETGDRQDGQGNDEQRQ